MEGGRGAKLIHGRSAKASVPVSDELERGLEGVGPVVALLVCGQEGVGERKKKQEGQMSLMRFASQVSLNCGRKKMLAKVISFSLVFFFLFCKCEARLMRRTYRLFSG